MLHHKLQKQEQVIPKTSRRGEIIKMRAKSMKYRPKKISKNQQKKNLFL
jgi:hypothetical protein